MEKLHVFAYALFCSIIAGETYYLRKLTPAGTRRSDSAERGAEPQRAPARVEILPVARAGAVPLSVNAITPARAPCPDPERAAREELERRHALEATAAQTARDQQVRQSRETVAERLSLGGTELDQLQAAGDALRDAERALRDRFGNGELPDSELDHELQSLWKGTEAEVERVLGRERYAEFSALRREHPELGRSLYVFRAGPGDER